MSSSLIKEFCPIANFVCPSIVCVYLFVNYLLVCLSLSLSYFSMTLLLWTGCPCFIVNLNINTRKKPDPALEKIWTRRLDPQSWFRSQTLILNYLILNWIMSLLIPCRIRFRLKTWIQIKLSSLLNIIFLNFFAYRQCLNQSRLIDSSLN